MRLLQEASVILVRKYQYCASLILIPLSQDVPNLIPENCVRMQAILCPPDVLSRMYSDASIFSNSSMSATKMSPFQIHQHTRHNRGVFPVKLSYRIGGVLAGLSQRSDETQSSIRKESWAFPHWVNFCFFPASFISSTCTNKKNSFSLWTNNQYFSNCLSQKSPAKGWTVQISLKRKDLVFHAGP